MRSGLLVISSVVMLAVAVGLILPRFQERHGGGLSPCKWGACGGAVNSQSSAASEPKFTRCGAGGDQARRLGAAISVSVTDQNGEAVRGVPIGVWVSGAESRTGVARYLEAKSNDSGAVRIPMEQSADTLDEVSWIEVASLSSAWVGAARIDSEGNRIQKALARGEFDLDLQPARGIALQFIDAESGAPLQGVQVYVSAKANDDEVQSPTTTTNSMDEVIGKSCSLGLVRVPADILRASGVLEVRAELEGRLPVTRIISMFGLETAGTFEVGMKRVTKKWSLGLRFIDQQPNDPMLLARVWDGEPMRGGAMVSTLVPSWGDNDGIVRFVGEAVTELEGSGQRLVVLVRGGNVDPLYFRCSPDELLSGTLRGTAKPSRSTISVFTMDHITGLPIAGAIVHLEQTVVTYTSATNAEDEPIRLGHAEKTKWTSDPTGSDGTSVFSSLPPGRYRASLPEQTNLIPTTEPKIDVNPTGTTDVFLQVRQLYRLTATLVGHGSVLGQAEWMIVPLTESGRAIEKEFPFGRGASAEIREMRSIMMHRSLGFQKTSRDLIECDLPVAGEYLIYVTAISTDGQTVSEAIQRFSVRERHTQLTVELDTSSLRSVSVVEADGRPVPFAVVASENGDPHFLSRAIEMRVRNVRQMGALIAQHAKAATLASPGVTSEAGTILLPEMWWEKGNLLVWRADAGIGVVSAENLASAILSGTPARIDPSPVTAKVIGSVEPRLMPADQRIFVVATPQPDGIEGNAQLHGETEAFRVAVDASGSFEFPYLPAWRFEFRLYVPARSGKPTLVSGENSIVMDVPELGTLRLPVFGRE